MMAALALGIGTLVAIASAELALRIYNPIHVPVRAYEIALPVNMVFKYRIEGATKMDPVIVNTHNSMGLRGPEPPDDFEAADTFVTVGGSTTACVGLTDEHAWPAVLFESLSARHSAVWLNNAGMDGHSTFGHLMMMRQVLARLKPDYVLFLIGVNDVGRADLNEWDEGIDPSTAGGTTSFIRHSELLSTLQVLWRTLRAHDLGVAVNGEVDFAGIGRRIDPPDRIAEEVAQHEREFVPRFEERVRALVTESRGAGIEPILITQPAFYGEGIDPTTGRELGELDVFGTSSMLKWKLLELYNETTRRVAADQSVMLIDAGHKLPKDSRFYSDFIHYSPEGAAEFAAIVADELEREILSR